MEQKQTKWQWFRKNVPKLARYILPDVLALAGAASVTYGACLIYAPAGWIVGGIMGIAAAVIVSRARG